MTEETIVSEFNEENKEIEETKQVNISKKKGSVMKMFFLILL